MAEQVNTTPDSEPQAAALPAQSLQELFARFEKGRNLQEITKKALLWSVEDVVYAKGSSIGNWSAELITHANRSGFEDDIERVRSEIVGNLYRLFSLDDFHNNWWEIKQSETSRLCNYLMEKAQQLGCIIPDWKADEHSTNFLIGVSPNLIIRQTKTDTLDYIGDVLLVEQTNNTSTSIAIDLTNLLSQADLGHDDAIALIAYLESLSILNNSLQTQVAKEVKINVEHLNYFPNDSAEIPKSILLLCQDQDLANKSEFDRYFSSIIETLVQLHAVSSLSGHKLVKISLKLIHFCSTTKPNYKKTYNRVYSQEELKFWEKMSWVDWDTDKHNKLITATKDVIENDHHILRNLAGASFFSNLYQAFLYDPERPPYSRDLKNNVVLEYHSDIKTILNTLLEKQKITLDSLKTQALNFFENKPEDDKKMYNDNPDFKDKVIVDIINDLLTILYICDQQGVEYNNPVIQALIEDALL